MNQQLKWVSSTALVAFTLATGCSVGLSGGSIEKSFTGIRDVNVLGPETVEITWNTNGQCNSYQIYQLSSSSSSSVGSATIPPARLTTPVVESDRAYTFAVGCVESDRISGLNITKAVTTWPKFNGLLNSTLDTTGQSPVVVLSWTPPATAPIQFEIYAQLSSVPGDLQNWQLTQTGGAGSGYSQTPLCTVFGSTARIGPSGDCSSAGLNSGQVYNFKVVARYPDSTYSNDFMGNGTSITIPSTFTPPNCLLTQAGLGADASSSYLFLRCDSAGSTGSCSLSNMSIKAFQAINGVRTGVSDTLNGAGTLRIEPQISMSQSNDRIVENLEIEYTCNSTVPATKAVIRYDGTQLAYPKPRLKYAISGYEKAPTKSIEQSPSYAGEAMAVGDFNCDGKPDLALGFPKVTYAQSPYFSKNTETGLVRIYYGYAQAADGTLTSTDSQYLSFRDLPSYAHFGQSLSAGNINRDVTFDSNSNTFYSCDDLIIGAPGTVNSPTLDTGAAYIFYGHPQKFPQPLDSSGLSVNGSTCSGNINSQICSPVKLRPNQTGLFGVDPNHIREITWNNATVFSPQFGFSVAYLRDYNADGYGDIAVGDPYCDWDGEAVNGYGYPQGFANKLEDVGCVYVYWGGPNGIQNTLVGTTPDNASNLNVPYVKVYAPIPQPFANFGYAIRGGGDVDVDLPVPIKQNGTDDIILASGNDFLVSAPRFNYLKTSNGAQLTGAANTLAWNLSGADAVDPIVLQGPPGFNDVESSNSAKVTAPWNGAWAPQTSGSNPWNSVTSHPVPSNSALAQSSGIVFLYKGRAPHRSYDITIKNGFNKSPHLVSTNPITNPLETLLSLTLRDRRNGSQFLTFTGTPDWTVSPVKSFYNCGSRGSPRGFNGGTGYYKHISCLAGRNNFSVIYPILRSGDSPVLGFGTTLGIAASKEENAVALYQLGQSVSASAFSRSVSQQLIPLSQGNTHDSIRGYPLWEIGVQAFNTYGTSGGTCERYTDSSGSNPQFSSAACPSYVGRLARSPLDESYTFSEASTGFLEPQPKAPIINDINKDGYADIGIGTAQNGTISALYTYFGNIAADFSYSKTSLGADTYGSGGGCNVSRLSTGVSADATGNFTTIPGSPLPYSTFFTKVATTNVSGTRNNWIVSEYPQFHLPVSGNYQRFSYLEDVTSASGAGGFSYNYTDINRTVNFGSNCYIQRRTYPTAPSDLVFGDANGDLIVDGVVGFKDDNSQQGKLVIAVASSAGGGIVNDTNYTNGSTPASKAGTSVMVSNWKFIDDTSRRDLFMGAPGYLSGQGIILNFNGSGTNVVSNTPSGSLLENSSAPNRLRMEESKIVGDINGDGYEDIWIPVKQIASNGGVYFDSIIYFGSSFGPITTSFCKSRVSMFKDSASGSTISASRCEAAATSDTALIDGTTVRLPQYLAKPTNMGANWALGAYSAGDVDQDGKGELIVFDSGTYSVNLFFGSDSGLVNGQPILGPSSNHVPQRIGGVTLYSTIYPMPRPSYADSVSTQVVVGMGNGSGVPYVFADFNGDGHSDIAFHAAVDGPRLNTAWNCSPGLTALNSFPAQCGTTFPYVAPQNPGPGVQGAGHIVVLYGSPSGVQTPLNAGGVAVDFEDPGMVCDNWMTTCTYSATGTAASNHYSEVYRTLNYNSGTGQYEIDTAKTACDPSTGTCKAQLVRNPVFFNDTIGYDTFANITDFGRVLAVADTNYDGIDDLVVGAPNFYHPNYTTAGATIYGGNTILGGTTQDSFKKGGIFLFYGAKGAGLVAPAPDKMVTDLGLAVSGAGVIPTQNRSVFALYPHPANPAQPASVPELDRDGAGNPIEYLRQIGISLSTGDFNGDGIDDIATASSRGQIYVYYGPICQIDNAKSTWQNQVYQNHNVAKAVTGFTPNDCTVMNLNTTLNPSTLNPVGQASAITKSLFPQMIYVSGITNQSAFGSTLLSRRPKRSVASTVVLSNPGNINGDPERTSDLIVGSSKVQDPNATVLSYKTTGLSYVFFGHKTPVAGEMATLPGLYISNASYNSSIISSVQGGNTYFFYTPMMLKPHTPDSMVGQFYYYAATTGDLNGDGRLDVVAPTADIQEAIDGTPVVFGGGFKLFY